MGKSYGVSRGVDTAAVWVDLTIGWGLLPSSNVERQRNLAQSKKKNKVASPQKKDADAATSRVLPVLGLDSGS